MEINGPPVVAGEKERVAAVNAWICSGFEGVPPPTLHVGRSTVNGLRVSIQKVPSLVYPGFIPPQAYPSSPVHPHSSSLAPPPVPAPSAVPYVLTSPPAVLSALPKKLETGATKREIERWETAVEDWLKDSRVFILPPKELTDDNILGVHDDDDYSNYGEGLAVYHAHKDPFEKCWLEPDKWDYRIYKQGEERNLGYRWLRLVQRARTERVEAECVIQAANLGDSTARARCYKALDDLKLPGLKDPINWVTKVGAKIKSFFDLWIRSSWEPLLQNAVNAPAPKKHRVGEYSLDKCYKTVH